MQDKDASPMIRWVPSPLTQAAKPDDATDSQKRASQRETQRVRNANARAHARTVSARRNTSG